MILKDSSQNSSEKSSHVLILINVAFYVINLVCNLLICFGQKRSKSGGSRINSKRFF